MVWYLGGGECHEFVVEESLPLAELAGDDVLVLLGHLPLDVDLEAAQDEGAQDLVGKINEEDKLQCNMCGK